MLTKKHPKASQAVAVKRLLFGLGDVITSTKDTFLNVQVVCEACYRGLNTSIYNIAQKFYWFTTHLVAENGHDKCVEVLLQHGAGTND